MAELKVNFDKEQLEEIVQTALNNVIEPYGITVEECIEKQIPKTPYKIHSIPFALFCPVCNEKCAEDGQIIHYCWNCGQKLRFGDD